MTALARLGVKVQGEGPPILFIMGRGAPGRVWEAHQVPTMVADGWKTITFDNRGTGANFDPLVGFSFDDFVTDVVLIIENYIKEPVFLVGTSLGSRIALATAKRHPQLVRAVVAAAAHARLTPIQIAHSKDSALVTKTLAHIAPDFLAAHTATMNLSRTTLLDDAANQDWLAMLSFANKSQTEGISQQIHADCGADHSAEYRQITVPVLALAYGDDRVIFPEQVQETVDLIPNAKYAELAQAGHFGYLERPAEFNSLVHQFFSALC